MRVGTKSLLVGSHQFVLHPLFVLVAWVRHHGWRTLSWRVLVCIVVHDWGYWGLPNMDGPEGKLHPMGGARLAARACSWGLKPRYRQHRRQFWYRFAAGHSRYYAQIVGIPPSPLMVADKYATVLVPRPLYWLMIRLSGEGDEYMAYHEAATGQASRNLWDYTGILQRHWGEFAPRRREGA